MVNIDDKVVLKLSLGEVSSAVCDAGTSVDALETPFFATDVLLCATGEAMNGCNGGDLCVPRQNAEGFAAQSCIYRQGLFDCPAESAYSEQHLVFDDIDDQRSCASSCACESPAGTPCGRVEVTRNVSQCNPPTAIDLSPGCTQNPSFDPGFVEYIVEKTEHSCQDAGTAAVNDHAVGTSPTTVCCTPGG
jgi:hypothetical protein